MSDSADSARRTAKNVVSDAERVMDRKGREGENAVDKAKDIAKDFLISKADDAKTTLKTVGRVADAAGDFIGEKKEEAQRSSYN